MLKVFRFLWSPLSFFAWVYFSRNSAKHTVKKDRFDEDWRAKYIYKRATRYFKRLGFDIEALKFPLHLQSKPTVFVLKMSTPKDYFLAATISPWITKQSNEHVTSYRIPVFVPLKYYKSQPLKSLFRISDTHFHFSKKAEQVEKNEAPINNFLHLSKDRKRYGVLFLDEIVEPQKYIKILKNLKNALIQIIPVGVYLQPSKSLWSKNKLLMEFKDPITTDFLLQNDVKTILEKLLESLK